MPLLAFALPIFSSIVGHDLLTRFGNLSLSPLESLAGGIPIGMTVITATAFLVNSVFPCSLFQVLFHCMLCGGIHWFLSKRPIASRIDVLMPGIPACIFLSSFFLFLSYIAFVAFLESPGKLTVVGEHDLFAEFAYIASFLKGVNSRRSAFTGLILPVAAGVRARSEFLPPFYAALLQSCGLSTQFAVFLQTIMLNFAIVCLQYSLTYRFSKSEFASCLSVPVLFLLGGFGFLNYLSTRTRLDPMVDCVCFLGLGRYNPWGHHLFHCFLTSRASLLATALAILSFCSVDGDSSFFAGLVGIAIIVIRTQTGFAFFLCYFLFKLRGFFRRLLFILPAFLLFRITHLSPSFSAPVWVHPTYANAMIPPIAFIFATFGLLLPALLLIAITPSLIPRVIAPTATFGLLAFVSLQHDFRMNFTSLLPTTVPLFVAVGFAALVAFRDRWQSDDIRGLVNCGIVFATIFMCLSSLTGLWHRSDQKFTVWDSNAVDLGKWVQKNTPKAAVFVSTNPPKWNPAVVIAGRCAYYPFVATLQTGEYDSFLRARAFSAFLYQNATLTDVDYYVIEKKTKLVGLMAEKIGVLVDLVYENARFQLLRARL
jgi:hypothetical protein